MRELSMTPFRLMSPLLAAALLLAMAACSRSPSTESAPTEAEGAEAPTESEAGIAPVKLDAAAMKAAGIVVQAVSYTHLDVYKRQVLTFTGQATMWAAVFADMGASLLVVGNGMRLLRK